MGNKILIQQLVEQLSQRTSLPQKELDDFVRLFFDTIVGTLEKEKNVKVKGLGIFKLVDVEPRASVDVNTGERINIEGHQKISFLPDATLKKRVNKPFEQFETVVINDGVDLKSMESLDNDVVADAIKEVEGDECVHPTAKEETMETETPHDAVPASDEDSSESTEDSNANQGVDTQADGIPDDENGTGTSAARFEHVIHPVQMEVELKGQVGENAKVAEALGHEKNENRWLRILLLFLTASILCAASYFAGYYKLLCPDCTDDSKTIGSESTPLIKKNVRKTVATDGIQPKNNQDSTATVIANTPVGKESGAASSGKEIDGGKDFKTGRKLDPSIKYNMDGTMDVYVIKRGDNIYKVAHRYYGHKDFASYIINYNHLENPNLITVGQKVKIPLLKK